MLVLNRKKGESIMIGENIEIAVIEIQGENIKLGISAPRSVSIYRREIYEEIIQANRQATQKLSNFEDKIKAMKELAPKED
ncbi:MAG TPA: carbon storage regulator CsrA [Syntrophomonadaceae bacterium]|nr:carbon storage regulator CsrA [Syntrophomonadaceae bacterium]